MKKKFLLTCFSMFVYLFPASLTLAQLRPLDPQQRLDAFFKKFDENSVAAMGQIPPKWDSHGNKIEKASFFSEQEIAMKLFLEKKDLLRQNLCPQSLPGGPCPHFRAMIPFAEMNSSNEINRFLEKSKETLVSNLSTISLQNGQVEKQPWSGDYWPTYRGGIASRYVDKTFPASSSWKDYKKYFSHLFENTNYKDPEVLKILSPAEKYDLLVGDTKFGLTRFSIEDSDLSVDDKGEIESWIGICHGWAPAAIQLMRPTKPVAVTLADGRQLTFFPDDLKALASLLWANADFDTRLSGGRCNIKEPKIDENGRIIDPQCWDSNPASFHLIVVNQLGSDHRSLIMDATYDYQVWNQPLVSYKMHYFNPETRDQSDSLEQTLIPIQDFTKDKFKKYRSAKTKKIVGVMMNLQYLVERSPDHHDLDRPEDDNLTNVEYYYDLEIDDKGHIIGGEWYQNAHPDFLWSPTLKAQALAPGEAQNSTTWEGHEFLPVDLQNLAHQVSPAGIPLERVLKALFLRSQEN